MTKNFDFRIKICVVGDQLVGKTSIIKRYTEDEFSARLMRARVGMDCKYLS